LPDQTQEFLCLSSVEDIDRVEGRAAFQTLFEDVAILAGAHGADMVALVITDVDENVMQVPASRAAESLFMAAGLE